MTANYLIPEDLEKQESLNLTRLIALTSKEEKVPSDRPVASFIQLIDWVEKNYVCFLKDQDNVNKFIHNRIIIDGQFVQFCEERNIIIDVLHKDAVISWKTDHNFEKFFAQGIFLIKNKNMEFIHCALFHKGNQNEDEVSFFILCSKKNYEAYVKFRNEFDAWVSERDRDNLHVRVIEGDDIFYTKDNSWEDLIMPDDIKTELRKSIEGFLASKELYQEKKIPWKRGILLFGPAGNGKSTCIKTIMAQYNFKPVTVIAGANEEIVREAFTYAEEQSPALLYFEDLDSLLNNSLDPSAFLNLMDGVATKNGLLVVATANDIKKLKSNVTDRPSRFDRKFFIPLPTADMAYIYLKKWFGNLLSVKKCRELAKYAAKNEFSYAYLKELYISSMFEALNKKNLTEKDIQTALNRLIKDKHLAGGGNINMDKYLR